MEHFTVTKEDIYNKMRCRMRKFARPKPVIFGFHSSETEWIYQKYTKGVNNGSKDRPQDEGVQGHVGWWVGEAYGR